MKKVKAKLKLLISGGEASPAPPIGPALAPYSLNLSEFCKRFNDLTSAKKGIPQRAVITLYEDRTFDLQIKETPAAKLLMKAANLEKASGSPPKIIVGKIKQSQIEEIARKKMGDFNTDNLESAIKMVKGTARSLGLEVVEG